MQGTNLSAVDLNLLVVLEALLATREFTSGPKKPALVAAFGPLGYDCRGESGTFTLRRRSAERPNRATSSSS